MDVEDRIKVFVQLGKWMESWSEDTFSEVVSRAGNENGWFTKESIQLAISGTVAYLKENQLRLWVGQYDFGPIKPMNVGLVMAGNIPLVGFHDLLCVLLSGHKAMVKTSSQDNYLMTKILQGLQDVSSELYSNVQLIERLNEAEAYIATGSDNSARYFQYYFGKKPYVIRQNRTSVAVLTGDESTEQLKALGKDIFTYFGLGCRNVSKVLVPEGYIFNEFFESIEEFGKALHHHKYQNNYDYNKSIYLVNRQLHLDNGFLLVTESKELVSPISVLYYETYSSQDDLHQNLEHNKEKIQCIVGASAEQIPFGEAQHPEVSDYADGVDTMKFLLSLKG